MTANTLGQGWTAWRNYWYQYRYFLLFFALMAMLIVPSFAQEEGTGIAWTITRTLVLLACINIVRSFGHSLIIWVIIGILGTGTEWLNYFDLDSNYTHLFGLLMFSVFVAMISFEVFKQILSTRDIDLHIIVGACCGFMLIGMIASLVFTLIHLNYPESFTNVAPKMEGVDDLFYFSFITILTIGYGDISPIGSEARSVSLFFGLIGQFYLAVIMAVLVGKFIGQPASDDADNS